ncbi:hypothetical protein GCM10008941_35920 [Rhizomicrobium palustre]
MAAAIALGAAVMTPRVIQDGELYWHIAAGRWMIENYAVLRIDPFSYTFTGHPWHTQGWLSQLMLTGAYLATGFSAVIALVALMTSLAAGALAFELARFLKGIRLFGALALAFIVAAGAVSARPYLMALPFAILYAAGLVRARADERRPSYWLLALMLLWANLNTGFLIGLIITFALGLEAYLKQRDPAAGRDWLIFSSYALMISLVTPYGFDGLLHAVRVLLIPADGHVHSVLPLLLALPAGSVLFVKKKTLIRAALVVLLLVLAVYLPAQQLLFAAMVPLLSAEALSTGRFEPVLAWRPVAALVVIALVGLGARSVLRFDPPDSAVRPATALAHVPEAVLRTPVLNEPSFGGYLVSQDVHPFIDSRPIYAHAFRARFAGLGDAAALDRVTRRYHIRWTILAPENPAVKTLDGMAGWKRLYTGPNAVVHVKKEGS